MSDLTVSQTSRTTEAVLTNITVQNTIVAPIFSGQNRDLDRGVTLERQTPTAQHTREVDLLRQELSKAVSNQGVIGRGFNLLKNLTGQGAGSNRAQEAITKFENGEIGFNEAFNSIQEFLNSQKGLVDTVASGAAVLAGGFTFAGLTATQVAAAPFTGGASLAAISLNATGAGLAGAGAYSAVEVIERVTGGTDYTLPQQLADMGKGFVFGTSTAIAPAVATTATQGARTILPQAQSVAGQAAERIITAGAGTATAGAVVGGLSAGTISLLNKNSPEEVIQTTSEGVVIGGLLGFTLGAGFEAAAVMARTPRPPGTTRENRQTSEVAKGIDPIGLSDNLDRFLAVAEQYASLYAAESSVLAATAYSTYNTYHKYDNENYE